MANFNTHVTGALIASSMGASALLSLQLVSQIEVIGLWFIGILGGLLPDIDADDSRSLRLIFRIFGLGLAFSVAIYFVEQLSIVGLWLVASGVFGLWRFLVLPIFMALTVHRGSLHSLLSCLMFAAITVSFTFLIGGSINFAYLAGLFVLIGMILHLSLDELYSIDLEEFTVKRSFGTALKPCSLTYPFATLLQCLICAAAIYFLPPLEPFLVNVEQAIESLEQDLFPNKEWQMLRHWLG